MKEKLLKCLLTTQKNCARLLEHKHNSRDYLAYASSFPQCPLCVVCWMMHCSPWLHHDTRLGPSVARLSCLCLVFSSMSTLCSVLDDAPFSRSHYDTRLSPRVVRWVPLEGHCFAYCNVRVTTYSFHNVVVTPDTNRDHIS